MRDRLTALGWSEIEVIDDDLGRSAAGGVQRAGFERMVAEVCLGKVGAVCAREVSRFARNSRCADLKPELEQFAVNARCTPKRIFDVHPPDQQAQRRGDLRSPSH